MNLELVLATAVNQDSSDTDPELKEALGAVLGFYGTQLQSHALTLVSLSVVIFTLFSFRRNSIVGTWGIAVAATPLLVVIAYLLPRLMVYVWLAEAILEGSRQDFAAFVNNYRSGPNGDWDQLFPHAKISLYANSRFDRVWLNKKHYGGIIKGDWIYTAKARPTKKILLTVGMVSFAVSFVFLFYY